MNTLYINYRDGKLWVNAVSSQKRIYTLRARAEHQEQTRRRIVAAAAALHEEVGPARTTVSEIAKRAGVQRLTVYNNFPSERELFAACGAHWLKLNPPPDPATALAIDDPWKRLRGVLCPLYDWYRATAKMTENIQRDRLALPALDAVVRIHFDQQLTALRNALTAGIKPRRPRASRIRAAVGLALDFWTWRCLALQELTDDDAADLMVDAVKTAAGA